MGIVTTKKKCLRFEMKLRSSAAQRERVCSASFAVQELKEICENYSTNNSSIIKESDLKRGDVQQVMTEGLAQIQIIDSKWPVKQLNTPKHDATTVTTKLSPPTFAKKANSSMSVRGRPTLNKSSSSFASNSTHSSRRPSPRLTSVGRIITKSELSGPR